MLKIEELLFSGKDNTMLVEYAGITFPTATKVEFTLNDTTTNSVDDPSMFVITLDSDGRIGFKLGAAGYAKADSGYATVTVYDIVNTNGVVYSARKGPTKLYVTVIE